MIELKNFSFQYREDAAPAVAGVNLRIADGAFVGITGAAGSGKSTLTYALNGIVPHCYPGDFYGQVLVEGLDTCTVSLTDISRLVGSVCQDIESQFVASVVDDEMLYGLENFGVPHGEVEPRIVEALEAMGIAELRERPIASLSGGQKQKVAIASILALKPRVLVLDEPTAELDPVSSVGVFELLARYAREHGTTVVVVEQKIALLSEYADLLVVVDGGRIAYAAPPAEVLEHAVDLLELGVSCPRATTLVNRLRARGLYAGAVCKNVDEAVAAVAGVLGAAGASVDAAGGVAPAGGVPEAGAAAAGGGDGARGGAAAGACVAAAPAPIIEFQDVEFAYEAGAPVLHGVGFQIHAGDFVAFVGTNGAGKSTTMRLLNGLLKPTAGRVLIDGVPTTGLATSQLARRVGFLFQNPDRQICCNTVREELLFGFECVGGGGPEAEARVDAVIEEFGFDPEADPFLLNRGTRQLLALASIIVVAPPVIVLDEPTTGLDYRACMKVMEVVRRLHEGGTTVVMVCHDMEVVADFATRVVVMHDGRVLACGPTFEVLRDRAACAEASVLPPQAVGISLGLAAGYPELAATALARANTVDELEAAVMELAGARAAAAGAEAAGAGAVAGAGAAAAAGAPAAPEASALAEEARHA